MGTLKSSAFGAPITKDIMLLSLRKFPEFVRSFFLLVGFISFAALLRIFNMDGWQMWIPRAREKPTCLPMLLKAETWFSARYVLSRPNLGIFSFLWGGGGSNPYVKICVADLV